MTKILAILLTVAAGILVSFESAAAVPRNGCASGLIRSTCGADVEQGKFIGLIALSGDSTLLNHEKEYADGDACAHCVWTTELACQTDQPESPQQVNCLGAQNNAKCQRRQVAERIFLQRPGTGWGNVGTYCIGGGNQIVPLSQIAIGDVNRYLKDVKPPDLEITFNPGTSLAGLATRVHAAPDRALRPVPFGGQGVTETITLAPVREEWSWGDGQAATFTDASIRTEHTYARGGHLTAAVTTTWGATYTITYQGLTFGPYNATGRITGRQTRPVTVVTSTPVLVSHG